MHLFPENQRGHVAKQNPRLAPGEFPRQRVTLHERRAAMTHTALICDCPRLQPLLPQMLICNKNTVRLRDWASLRAALRGNVWLVRQTSAWMSAKLLVVLFDLLARFRDDHCPDRVLLLSMDAARIHLQDEVGAAARSRGIRLLVIPARLTWLLQPLDTHVFFRYKRYLRTEYSRRAATSPNGRLDVFGWMQLVTDCIRTVLCGHAWKKSFDDNGFGERQAALSSFILRELDMQAPPTIADTMPSSELLALLFPRRSLADLDAFFNMDRPVTALPALLAPMPTVAALQDARASLPPPPLVDTAPPSPFPHGYRLRESTRRVRQRLEDSQRRAPQRSSPAAASSAQPCPVPLQQAPAAPRRRRLPPTFRW